MEISGGGRQGPGTGRSRFGTGGAGMTNLTYALLQLGVMALVTYLVRMLPMTLFTKKIKSRFLRSFLYFLISY